MLLDYLPAAPKTRIKEISDQVEEFSKVPIRLANLSASMFQMGNGPEKMKLFLISNARDNQDDSATPADGPILSTRFMV